ncbi:MAG: hypothetical protein AAGJ40_09235 [Planctomycetota bacterium]
MRQFRGREFIFRSFDELSTVLQAMGQRRIPVTNLVKEHFDSDWSDCDALKRLGLTAIEPVVTLECPMRGEPNGRNIDRAVMCDGGMITIHEIRLSMERSPMLPCPKEIRKRSLAVRGERRHAQNDVGEIYYGFSGPGIRECPSLAFA